MSYLFPREFRQRFPWQMTRGSRSNTSRPWSYTYPTGTAGGSNGFTVVNESRTLVKGKKVNLRGMIWSPVRPYSRRDHTLVLKPGRDYTGDGPTLAESTKFVDRFGFPSGLVGTGWLGYFPVSESTTGGLCSSTSPILSDNVRNRLIAEAMVKVGSRKANYGETLGEGRKTLNHLANTASQLARAALAARRGNFRAFADALRLSRRRSWNGKTASERWLEYQYAWMPLMGDIYDTAEVLRDGLKRDNYLISGTRQLSIDGEYNYYVPSFKDTLKGPVKGFHRCKLWYTLRSSDVDALSRLGLINPFEVAWALMPFSFVIDWFVPVGTLLEAYSSTMGLSFVDGVISSKATISASATHYNTAYTNPFEGNIYFGWNGYWMGFQRHKVTNPTPLPYTIPSPFSTKRVLSALALVRQLSR